MLRRLLTYMLCIASVVTLRILPDNQEIRKIEITGNTFIPDQTVLTKIPYRTGDTYDPHATKTAIHSLYQLGLFRNVRIRKSNLEPSGIQLTIELEEKDRVEEITFSGNKQIKDHKLRERIEADEIKTVDPNEVQQYEKAIRSAYQEKNFHNAQVTTNIERVSDKRIKLNFSIDEGKRSVIKRVQFQGNNSIPAKELRKHIFSREEWILSFFDKAGTYHPDAVEQDKYMIENLYQSNGFLAARVQDAITEPLDDGNFLVTFVIDEGDVYTISDIHIEGNELLSEETLLASIELRPGQLYSKHAVRRSLHTLRNIWGEYGYVYADIHPSLEPDEENKNVKIIFNSQLGNRIFVDRINIVGNTKTSEKVIRRQLSIDEGDMITQRQLDTSKYRLQALGYFDQQSGVNWRFMKKDEEHADLDLVLNETKTGHMNFSVGLNPNGPQSPTDGITISGGWRNINAFGSGIQYNVNGSYSQNDSSIDASITDNWLFDKPIASTVHAFTRKSTYEEFSLTQERPEERISGGMVSFGARPMALDYTQITGALGVDDIRYDSNLTVRENVLEQFTNSPTLQEAIRSKVDRSFQPGTTHWIASSVSQDYRNHPHFPSRGYVWNFDTKLALPTDNATNFAFFKAGLAGDWYTPLIGENTLVLHAHGYVGAMTEQSGRSIPYRELFHIGGSATVRGYEFGQIGPQLLDDSLGGKKSLLTNVELLFPITGDGNMRGVVFYDGGASWDTPQIDSDILQRNIKNDAFEYRHSIGLGFRATSPVPIRVDWGFKLDRKKARDEDISKVHITMSQDF